mmetsp:Transcript_149/g.225  ORF Transcript_149/g.225 Transcript_149/m.225 type:complete len:338 (-) Transcript_149:152-1165(-)
MDQPTFIVDPSLLEEQRTAEVNVAKTDAESTQGSEYTSDCSSYDSSGSSYSSSGEDESDYTTDEEITQRVERLSFTRKPASKKEQTVLKDTDISKLLLGLRSKAEDTKASDRSVQSYDVTRLINSLDKPPTRSISMPTIAKIDGTPPPPKPDQEQQESPVDVYKSILSENGITYQKKAAKEMEDFFEEVTEDQIKRYTQEVTNAVRNEDIEHLQYLHDQGLSLKTCNKFGESLLHMACRRGCLEIVEFLIDEAEVKPNIKDDYGRTPLHDAFWTVDLNADLILFLIAKCPELMMVGDARGFVPLNYARKEQWPTVCEFLRENASGVLPAKDEAAEEE